MTPTEQDKELRELYKQIRNNSRVILYNDVIGRPDEDGNREQTFRDDLWAISTAELDKFVELITADRKRVALEARIDELEHIKILHRKEVYTTISGDDVNIHDRIAELKAQQEEFE